LKGARLFALMALAAMTACAGSIPSIPNTPEAIVEKGDQYFERGKYFQASELYKAFMERYAGHDRSDYAQFRLAESYFADEQYPLAAVEYQVLISNYGYSEYVDDAIFRMGVCFWEQAPKSALDQQRTVDALSRFNQFLQTFPNSPLVPEAKRYVQMCNARLAEKDLSTARFYFRHKKDRAASIYCDKIIEKFPDNEAWAEAHYIKGCILLTRGEKDEAARHFSLIMSYPEDLRLKDLAQAKLKETRE